MATDVDIGRSPVFHRMGTGLRTRGIDDGTSRGSREREGIGREDRLNEVVGILAEACWQRPGRKEAHLLVESKAVFGPRYDAGRSNRDRNDALAGETDDIGGADI